MADKITYEVAEDAKPIAAQLIRDFHQHLLNSEIPLLLIFRSTHSLNNSKPRFGTARRVTGLSAFLAYRHLAEDDEDVPPIINVIELAKDLWLHLTPAQRIALVDHELCHFHPEGGMRAHDVEEFRIVIERHGLWTPDVAALAETISQQKLFADATFATT